MKYALVFILALFATQCSADFVNTLLNAQNAYRTVLNVAPLTWSDNLAESAQAWADHLAEIGSLVHSGSSNGENLAYITGTYTGDTGDSTTNESTDNTSTDNGNTDNASTDSTNTDNANTDSTNTDNTNTNTDNSNNGDDSSNNGGFLPIEPATSSQPQGNSQSPSATPSTTSTKPKTHWSKTKTDNYGISNTYTGDGGNSDGRRLSSNGRRLSESDTGDADLVRLVGLWGAEKQYFVYGNFPDVSSTGDWSDVGHYTQLVWANTKQVGCGIANGHGNEYLVCQYYPAGNWDGETVY